MSTARTVRPDSDRGSHLEVSSPVPPLRVPAPRRRRPGRWLLLAAVAILAAITVAWGSGRWNGSAPQVAANVQMHEVRRGVLEITVVEQGNLESASNVDVRCEVEGGRVGSGAGSGPGTQIIWLFREGEFVRKGDKIIELEQSSLKQQEIEQQILYENARKELIAAKNSHEAAKIAVEEYAKGTFPQTLETIESEITVAKEELRRAEEYAKYSEGLYRKGFVTKLSLEADQFAVENAKLKLQAAETKKSALVDFTKKKTIVELESARDSAEATARAGEAKFALEENKLELIRDQLSKCIIHAPSDGMVIYANDRDRRGRVEGQEIEEGAMVRYRQVIVQLPDLSQMRVKAKVHESMIERVKRDQKVKISIDALPQLALHGVVTSINNQPEPGSWFASNVKEYAVSVTIDEKVENLKPGMTAEVEIQVDRLENVLTVPVQAVVQKGEQSFCYVAEGAELRERPVILGESNDVFIEIKDGLNEGDRVILHPRSLVPDAREQVNGAAARNGNGNGLTRKPLPDVEPPSPTTTGPPLDGARSPEGKPKTKKSKRPNPPSP